MNPPWLKENSDKTGHWLEIALHCQPGAKKTEIQGEYADRLKVRSASPPIDGKANDELKKWFAKRLGLNNACIELISGECGKQKKLRVRQLSAQEMLKRLELT